MFTDVVVQNSLLRSVTSVFYAPSVTPTSSQSTTATATQSISTTATATYTPSSTGSVLPSASYSPTVPPSTTPTAAPSVTPTPSPDSYSVTPTPSPSFFDARLSPRHWQKPTTGPSNDTVLIVVAMSSTSGLNWLQQQPFPFVVMTKGAPAGTPNNLEINRGRCCPAVLLSRTVSLGASRYGMSSPHSSCCTMTVMVMFARACCAHAWGGVLTNSIAVADPAPERCLRTLSSSSSTTIICRRKWCLHTGTRHPGI
jgi:hypothetical protein